MSAPLPRAATKGASVNATRLAAVRASYRTVHAAMSDEINEIDRMIAELQQRKARLVEERFERLLAGAAGGAS